MAGDGGALHRYLVEGIALQLWLTNSCCSGGNPKVWSSGSSDDGAAVSCSLLGALFVEQYWVEEAGGGSTSSCTELRR
jgi:hypothetical protein